LPKSAGDHFTGVLTYTPVAGRGCVNDLHRFAADCVDHRALANEVGDYNDLNDLNSVIGFFKAYWGIGALCVDEHGQVWFPQPPLIGCRR